jgi:hypothetical protein
LGLVSELELSVFHGHSVRWGIEKAPASEDGRYKSLRGALKSW